MMQPEDKIQEIAERAERLQEIGSSILRAARDELYLGMRFLDVALSSFSYQSSICSGGCSCFYSIK